MTGNLAYAVGEVAARSVAGAGATCRTVLAFANSTVRVARTSPSSLRDLTSPAQRER